MTNTLYTNDNLFILHGLNSASVDLIYLDPPFNSKRVYSGPIGSKAAKASFKDMWTWADVNEAYLEKLVDQYPALVSFIESISDLHSSAMMAYITYMTQRLIELHRVLKPTGSLYLHVDPTASHYLKLVLDRIFGKRNFRNEIVWGYRTGGVSKRYLPRKHDIILAYGKDAKQSVHNPPKEIILYDKPFFTGGQPDDSGKYPVEVYVRDVWDNELKPIINVSKERTGYPTQKPLALLERIIKASSNEGDLVLDPFCGCATTCVKAQHLNRTWIGIDIEKQAAELLVQRLSDDAGFFKDFIHTKQIPQRTDIEKVLPSQSVKERLYKTQAGKCNGCFEEFNIFNLEVDHIIPKSKGGGDHYENYQLLCGNCNRVKGNRPMEYLRAKIKIRQALLDQQITFGT